MLKISLFLSLFFYSTTLLSEEIKVRFVHVQGPLAVTHNELITIAKVAGSYYANIPISFKVVKIKEVPDVCAEHRTLQGFLNQANCFRQLKLKRFRYGPTIFVAPPLTAGNAVFTAGVALSGQCNRRKAERIGIVNAVAKNQDGAPRLEAAGLYVAHELAHTYGATHDESNHNIMSSIAGHYFIAGETLRFNIKAVQQMLFCPNR